MKSLNFKTINNLIKNNSELHYISDCTEFISDNDINTKTQLSFLTSEFIMFENTTQNWNELIETLNSNNIEFTEDIDELNLSFITV